MTGVFKRLVSQILFTFKATPWSQEILALLVLAGVIAQPPTGDCPSVIVFAKLEARKVQVSASASITIVRQCLHLDSSTLFEPLGGRSLTVRHPVQK